MTSECPTRLLSDVPAESDAFGSHQRVAEAIASLVGQETGGKAIALTGTWGSGKSTVVSLLKSILSKTVNGSNPQTAVFVYDAWVHQGDPLRRSFLEAFISFLGENNWTKRPQWEPDLERISRRREDVETKSEPVLTGPGRLLAVSALLLPIGYALLSAVAEKAADSSIGFAGSPVWVVGLLLSLSPALIACVTWLAWRPTFKPWKKRFWATHRAPHESDSIVSVFIHKTREVTTSRTVRTPDPTSLEFQEIFRRILADCLVDPNHRLIVIMDNLDRVPPQDALTIWSTMRAFFEVNYPESKWLARFWLLVPFDRKALERLWAHHNDTDARPEDSKDQLVDAFADKTFQVEFRVSPPVLSDWKRFLLDQLADALPAHRDDGSFYTIYRLFRLCGLPSGRSIAPRDVKVFINNLGSLHRQWQDDIPLAVQALYVLYAKRITNPQEDLVKDDFLDPKILNLVADVDWRQYLAALYFNVEPNRAYEVLIGKPVEDALSSGDTEAFSKLQTIPGLVTVCDHVLEENCFDWGVKEPAALATSALVLEGVGGNGRWRDCWQWLTRGISRVEKWTGLNEQNGRGIVAIFCHANGDLGGLARTILKALGNDTTLADAKETSPGPQDIQQWVLGSLFVVNALQQGGYSEAIKSQFRVPGAAGSYLEALTFLHQRPSEKAVAGFFLPQCGPAEIINELSRICKAGQFSEKEQAAVEMLLNIQRDWPWDGLFPVVSQRLEASTTPKPEEMKACLWALLLLNRNNLPKAQQTFQTLCRQGHLMHQLHAVQNQPTYAALITLAHLIALPDGNIQSAPANANTGKQFYQNLLSNPSGSPDIAQQVSSFSIELGMPEIAVTAFKEAVQTKALAAEVLRQTVSRDDVERQIPSEYLLKEYEAIIQLLDDSSLERLTQTLVDRGNMVPQIARTEFSKTPDKLYAFTYDASSTDSRQMLGTVLLPALKSLDKAAWLPQLQQEGYLLRLLVSMTTNDLNPDLGEGFHDALLDHAEKIIAGGKMPTKFMDRWALIPRSLEASWRKTLADNLWDKLNDGSTKSLKNFLGLYAQFLLDSEVSSSTCDMVVRQALPAIIGRNEPEELAWVIDLLDRKSDFFGQAQKHSRDTFKERIETKLRDCEDENLRANLERIARAIGVIPETIYAEKTQAKETAEDAKE